MVHRFPKLTSLLLAEQVDKYVVKKNTVQEEQDMKKEGQAP